MKSIGPLLAGLAGALGAGCSRDAWVLWKKETAVQSLKWEVVDAFNDHALCTAAKQKRLDEQESFARTLLKDDPQAVINRNSEGVTYLSRGEINTTTWVCLPAGTDPRGPKA